MQAETLTGPERRRRWRGYVFGMHLNYDERLDPEQISAEAASCGGYGTPYPHRRFARLWLPRDYEDATLTATLQLAVPEADSLEKEIERNYRQVRMRDDAVARSRLDAF
jgi:hypothetical protein